MSKKEKTKIETTEEEVFEEETEDTVEEKVGLLTRVKADPKDTAKRVGKKALGVLIIGGLGFIAGRATLRSGNCDEYDDNVIDVDYSEE